MFCKNVKSYQGTRHVDYRYDGGLLIFLCVDFFFFFQFFRFVLWWRQLRKGFLNTFTCIVLVTFLFSPKSNVYCYRLIFNENLFSIIAAFLLLRTNGIFFHQVYTKILFFIVQLCIIHCSVYCIKLHEISIFVMWFSFNFVCLSTHYFSLFLRLFFWHQKYFCYWWWMSVCQWICRVVRRIAKQTFIHCRNMLCIFSELYDGHIEIAS